MAIICLLLPFWSISQQFPLIHHTTLDGLANNAVRSLFIDSRGFLWVGTEHGVSLKENGNFQNFYTDDGLAHGSCWAITEDSKGQMWFGSYGGGITKFDGEKFTSFPLDNGLIDSRIRHFYPYQNKIFVGTENGISIIDIDTEKITSIENSVLNSPQSYVSGFFEHEGIIFYSTYGMGVYSFDPNEANPNINLVNEHSFIYAMKKIGGKVYSSNKGFVDEFLLDDFIAGEKPKNTFGKSIVWDYLSIDQKAIYMAAWGIYANNGGAYLYKDQQFENLSTTFDIDSKSINSIVYSADKEVIYLGSLDNGVYAVSINQDIIYHPFGDKEILDLSFENNQKAILHQDGFSIFTQESELIKIIERHNFKRVSENYVKSRKHQLPKHEDDFFELDFETGIDEILFYEMQSNDGNYWICSNIGIFELSEKGDFLNYLPIHSYKIGFTPDGKFIETNPYGGVRIYNDVSKMDYEYFSFEQNKNIPTTVSKVIRAKDKTYFSSVFEGLFHWNGSEFHSYKYTAELPLSKIKQMHITRDGKLVLATEFDAIYIAEDKGTFEIQDTIERSQIVGKTVLFLESYQDHILIGTEKGLNIYHNGNVRVLDDEQGLSHMLFKTAKVDNELLYIGTNSGYYVLDLPKILQAESVKFQLSISQVSINQKPIGEENFSWFVLKHDQLKLPSGENTLLLKFKPVGHKFPEKLLYRYRLLMEDEWSPYSSEPQIFLSYLPAGNYSIEVEVYDQFSGKNTVTTLLKLQILRPFYQNPWIIVLFMVSIFAISFVSYRARMKKLNDQKASEQKIQRQLAETELEALRSQMNPHFIFNAINSIQYYILTGDIDKANEFIGKFSILIRKTLKNSSKPYIKLSEEWTYLQTYIEIENERKGGHINWSVEIDPSIEIDKVSVPPMLIQPIIENVFIHAFSHNHPNPTLSIYLKAMDFDTLVCTVKDNGVGMQKVKKNPLHDSKGIDLVNRRVSLIKGKEKEYVTFSTTVDSGTKVEIEIPFR